MKNEKLRAELAEIHRQRELLGRVPWDEENPRSVADGMRNRSVAQFPAMMKLPDITPAPSAEDRWDDMPEVLRIMIVTWGALVVGLLSYIAWVIR